jgi:hypothetical protein
MIKQDIIHLFKPSLKNISLFIGLFIVFQFLDIWFERGSGLGFPLKFYAMGLFGLSAGYFKIFYLLLNILFFYILSALFFQSKMAKISVVTFLFLLVLIFLI